MENCISSLGAHSNTWCCIRHSGLCVPPRLGPFCWYCCRCRRVFNMRTLLFVSPRVHCSVHVHQCLPFIVIRCLWAFRSVPLGKDTEPTQFPSRKKKPISALMLFAQNIYAIKLYGRPSAVPFYAIFWWLWLATKGHFFRFIFHFECPLRHQKSQNNILKTTPIHLNLKKVF